MQIRLARATDVYRFHLLTRTESAPCWVTEIESWFCQDAWFWFREPSNEAARLWIGELDGELVMTGAAQRISESTWYVPGLLVECASRSKGLGRKGLVDIIGLIRAEQPTAQIEWLSHEANAVMHHLAAAMGAAAVAAHRFPCGTEGVATYHRWRLRPSLSDAQ